MKRINGHSHLLPYPHEIPQFMKDKEIFWIDDAQKFMFQKNWKRPITDPSFFLTEKLDWMQKHKIDHSVVLNLSQLYGNGLPLQEMKDALRFQNDFNAKIQQENPSKFTTGFVVNPIDIDFSLQEIERCVTEHQMQLLCLPTHYLSKNGKWQVIFHEENKEIFELANHYHLAIEIHPYDGEKFIQLENTSWRFHLIWMLAQCADAYHFLSLDGYYEAYQNIRFCFAHGGQLAQMNLGRRIQGFDGRRDLFEGKNHPRKAVNHPNIFFDTLLHDTNALQLLIENQGVSQVLIGLDDPYPLGEMECEMQSSYPGKILDLAEERTIISSTDKAHIWDTNVTQWLFGNDENKKSDFYNRLNS